MAQRSPAAAKEIKDQISRSSGQVQNGVRLVGEAGEALKRISDQVKTASGIVGKIAHSASEQDTTLRSISSSLNQLDAATQHNAAMAEEMQYMRHRSATQALEQIRAPRRHALDRIEPRHLTAVDRLRQRILERREPGASVGSDREDAHGATT